MKKEILKNITSNVRRSLRTPGRAVNHSVLLKKDTSQFPKWMLDEVAACDIEMTLPPRTVLDIGANVGAFALRAHARWPEAIIRCYEPVAENYRGLAKNISAHRNIQAYRFAVRSFSGTDKILIGDRGVTCGFYQLGRQTDILEKVMCVDAAHIPGAELVKIDTEGCEVEIISRLDLSKTRALIVEYHRPEDAHLIKTLAVTVGFQLLEEKPEGTANHGILKFSKEGAHLNDHRINQSGLMSAATKIKETNAERRIYVAVASHFSNHDLIFLQAMMQLVLRAPCPMSFGWSCDPSVERARNVLTANFLASNCTHLLFIDADIAFSADDVKRIVSHDEDVVGGIYPLKTTSREVTWCGNGLETPSSAPAPREDGLQEVGCIGTGFLCISRRALEKMRSEESKLSSPGASGLGPRASYIQDWPPYREEYAFWSQEVREVGGKRRFLTEDWNFCYRYRELGGKIFADTRVVLKHAGRAVWPLDLQTGNPFHHQATKTPGNNILATETPGDTEKTHEIKH